jgi:hypothetical protein
VRPNPRLASWRTILAAQQRLFDLLGSPADQKKHVLFEAGHGNLPRYQVEKETLAWFDRHLVTLQAPPPARAPR